MWWSILILLVENALNIVIEKQNNDFIENMICDFMVNDLGLDMNDVKLIKIEKRKKGEKKDIVLDVLDQISRKWR